MTKADVTRPLKIAGVGAAVGVAIGLVVGHPLPLALGMVGVLLIGNGALVIPRWRQAAGITERAISAVAPGAGTVRVSGTARPDKRTTEAPLTGADCLAWVVEVEEYRQTAAQGSGRTWRDAGGDADTLPFVLDDGTGTAWITPQDAEFFLDPNHQERIDGGQRPPDHLARFLRGAEMDPTTGVPRRFTEYRLDEADEVSVTGAATQPPAGAGSDARQPVVALSDGPDVPLFAIDSDPDTDVGSELRSRVLGGIGMGLVLVAAAVGGALLGLIGAIGGFLGGLLPLLAVGVLTGDFTTG